MSSVLEDVEGGNYVLAEENFGLKIQQMIGKITKALDKREIGLGIL